MLKILKFNIFKFNFVAYVIFMFFLFIKGLIILCILLGIYFIINFIVKDLFLLYFKGVFM